YSQHSDTNIDALFERQKRALDLAERKRATREFEQYAIGQAYNIMLFWWQSWCTTSASTAGGLRPATTLATTLPRYGSSRRRAHDDGGSVRRLGRTRRQQGRWPEPCWQTTDAVHEALGAANGGLSDGTVRVAGLHGLAALGARKMYVVGLSRRHEQAYVFQPFGRQPSLPTAALHGEAVGRFLVGAAKLVAALVGVDPQLDG